MSLATNIINPKDYRNKDQTNIAQSGNISQIIPLEYGTVQYNLDTMMHRKLSYDELRNIVLRLSDGSRVEYVKIEKKSKLPLVLSAVGLSSLIATALIGLPEPYGIILSVAMCGPLYVSLYGLKKNG